jgi:uncharacterized protein (DUF58 family)
MLPRDGVLHRLATFLWSPAPGTHIRLRLRLPLLLVAVLLLPAVLTPDRIWTTLLVGLSGLIVIGYLWTRLLATGLTATRHLQYGWISVGDQLQEEFAITNAAIAPALWVEVTDDSTVPGYNAAVVQSVDGRTTVRWRQTAVCTRRGPYRLGPWSLRAGDPFGLFELIHHMAATEEIIIHPPILSRLPVPLPPGHSEGRARTTTRAWQATVNAATVRDYQLPDPFNWIHWKTTARRDALYVRQFDRDAAGDIWLVIDGDASVQLGQGINGTEEQAVLLAASLAARAILEARPAGLAAYGARPQVVAPGLGQAQRWAVLRALALLQADGDTPLDRALRDLAGVARPGSAAVIITPSADPAWLAALVTLAQRGVECDVLLLDRRSFDAAQPAGVSAGLQRAIVAAGFPCRLLSRDAIAQPLPEGERHGYWEFKVTGTGKAIAVRRPHD